MIIKMNCHTIRVRKQFSTYPQQHLFSSVCRNPQLCQKSSLDYTNNISQCTIENSESLRDQGVYGTPLSEKSTPVISRSNLQSQQPRGLTLCSALLDHLVVQADALVQRTTALSLGYCYSITRAPESARGVRKTSLGNIWTPKGIKKQF